MSPLRAAYFAHDTSLQKRGRTLLLHNLILSSVHRHMHVSSSILNTHSICTANCSCRKMHACYKQCTNSILTGNRTYIHTSYTIITEFLLLTLILLDLQQLAMYMENVMHIKIGCNAMPSQCATTHGCSVIKY